MSAIGREIDAIINHVADDYSHAFVKIIEDFSLLNEGYIADRKVVSYKFKPDKKSRPIVNQILRIKILGDKRCEVVSNVFHGIKKSVNGVIPLGKRLSKVVSTVYAPDNDSFKAIGLGSGVDFFLFYGPENKLFVAEEVQVKDIDSEVLDEIENSFKELCRNFLPEEKIKFEWFIELLSDETKISSVVQSEGRKLIPIVEDSNNQIREMYLDLFGHFGTQILDVSTAKKILNDDLKKLIANWMDDVFPEDFITIPHLVVFQSEVNLPSILSTQELIQLFEKIGSNKGADKLLASVYEKSVVSDLENFKLWKRLISLKKGKLITDKELYAKTSDELLFKVWKDDIEVVDAINLKRIINQFKTSDFTKLMSQVSSIELVDLLEGVEVSSLELFNLLIEFCKNEVLKAVNYFVFDLEVSPKTKEIKEFAFISNLEEKEELEVTTERLDDLRFKMLSSDIVIGHNIVDFDFKFLFEEVEYMPPTVWDTLKMEVLLDPTKSSYALNTEHTALIDSENTLKLLCFQLFRVKTLISENEIIKKVVPSTILEVLNKIPKIKFENTLLIEIYREIFRLPLDGIKNRITSIVPKGSKIIVTPRSSWSCFIDNPHYLFYDGEKEELNLILSEEIVNNKLKDTKFLHHCVLRYLNQCQARNEAPYFRRLSPYLKEALGKILSIDQLCRLPNQESEYSLVTPFYYVNNKQNILDKCKTSGLCFLGVDQWKYESSTLLGTFTTEELETNKEAKELWVNFSNGFSVAPVSNQLVDNLVGGSVKQGNYWVEKKSLDRFELYCSIPSLEELALSDVFKAIEFNMYSLENLAQPMLFRPGKDNSNVSLNPETLYRDIYWNKSIVLLMNLIKGDYELNRRIVFVVNRLEEVALLQRVLKDLKIYCPSHDAGIRRRFELLQAAQAGVLVCAQSKLDDLLQCDCQNSVIYILESLSPNELLIKSGQSNVQQILDELEDSSETSGEDVDTKNEQQNLTHEGSTIKKLPSLSDYYNWLLAKISFQNSNNQFGTIDPRGNKSVFGKLNIKVVSPDNTRTEEQKKELLTIIESRTSKLFHAPKEFNLDDFDLHLERISSIFLKGKGKDNSDGDFLPEQREYLNYIMPANQDVLVTLPTGTGKSVLFQGPSLYRSSFTGKLSIVVTPLKALMEDHVMGLWKLGFWNSVEFINSDKGLEVQDIYRRIAGGELLMVFVTPERFRSRGFIKSIKQRLKFDGSFEYIIFDEAHCISQWGSEFRPDYFYCAKQIRNIRKTADSPILLLSATVTKQVSKSIKTVLYGEV